MIHKAWRTEVWKNMTATTMISAFALLLLISQVAFAQQWTRGGRRKHVGELLPSQSCYVEEVSIQKNNCHSV